MTRTHVYPVFVQLFSNQQSQNAINGNIMTNKHCVIRSLMSDTPWQATHQLVGLDMCASQEVVTFSQAACFQEIIFKKILLVLSSQVLLCRQQSPGYYSWKNTIVNRAQTYPGSVFASHSLSCLVKLQNTLFRGVAMGRDL